MQYSVGTRCGSKEAQRKLDVQNIEHIEKTYFLILTPLVLNLSYLGFLKFIYSEKATKLCEISTNYLSYICTASKIIGGDFANFVAFSEYINFNTTYRSFMEVLDCWVYSVLLNDRYNCNE